MIHQVSSSLWLKASDRTKSINLELLEDMFRVDEKEKAVNSGELTVEKLTLYNLF